MHTMETATKDSFHTVLAAPSRSLEIPESADVYGWLVGSWVLEVLHYRAVDVSSLGIKGEAHFGWVLEGRAIQDVWIMPSRPDRKGDTDKTNNMYGTTLRVWEPSLQAWLIRWINPVRGHLEEQIGRRIGRDTRRLRWRGHSAGPS